MGEKMVVDSSFIRCLTPSNTCTRRMLYTETSSLKTCSMTNSSTSKSAILASLNTKISTSSMIMSELRPIWHQKLSRASSIRELKSTSSLSVSFSSQLYMALSLSWRLPSPTNSTACFSLAISNHTLQKLREMRLHTTSKTSSWVSFLTVASTDQHFQKLESTHG